MEVELVWAGHEATENKGASYGKEHLDRAEALAREAEAAIAACVPPPPPPPPQATSARLMAAATQGAR